MKEKKNNYGTNPETGAQFKTQWEVIFQYLKEGNSITSREAAAEFGFTRLSDIIYKIEKHTGRRADRELIFVPTRYGGEARVARYWFEMEPGEWPTIKD